MKPCWAALPALFVVLAACAPAPPPLPAEATASLALLRPTAVPSRTPSLAPAIEYPAKLDQQACLGAGGEVHEFRLESSYLAEPMPVRVYTPPCYFEEVARRYPVLYLIHGQTYAADQWDRLGVDQAASQLVASGELAPFLIVMPQDSQHFIPPEKNPFDDIFLEELIPWVESEYRVAPGADQRAVGGLSRGASWALYLGLNYPDRFAAVGGHSPPIFAEEAWKVRGLLDALDPSYTPRLWLDIGERDQQRILQSAIWFEGLLSERNIPHEWHLFTGDHSETYWGAHIELYLRWYAAEW